MAQIYPNFLELSQESKCTTLMCPTLPKHTKVVNKFIKILFDCRDKIDEGLEPNDIFLNI